MAARKSYWRWILALVIILAGVFFLVRWDRQRSVQVIRTAKVDRQDIHSGVITNGKSEPVEYRDVRAEIDGEVVQVLIHDGDRVQQGQKVVEISQRGLASELERDRAELTEAQEALRILKQGGTALERGELKSQVELAKREREEAAKLVAQNERLQEKGAIARVELDESRTRLAKAESDLSILNQKLNHRYDPEEVAKAEARVQADRAVMNVTESKMKSTAVASPLQGISYSVTVRPGDYVHTGDLLARVGEFQHIRVRVYVDEPDLGRVAKAQPVLVTWDGAPGKQWRGIVDRLPSEIKDLGTRKVGDVACLLDNPQMELLPNMSLNVEIVTDSKPQALTVPREAIVGTGRNQRVFVVRDGALVSQIVRTGITNSTRIEVIDGLKDGDEVALSSDTPLREGMRIRNEES